MNKQKIYPKANLESNLESDSQKILFRAGSSRDKIVSLLRK